MQIAANNARMFCRRRSLVRFVPFTALREEEQEGTEIESEGWRAAPVQPAGYSTGAAQDPADLIAERDAVQRTMAQIPDPLRLCLLLSVVGGLSSREIARVLNLGEAAVRQRLARARKLFQRLYLLESGEAIADGSSLTSQTEARDQRLTLAIRSRPAMAAMSTGR